MALLQYARLEILFVGMLENVVVLCEQIDVADVLILRDWRLTPVFILSKFPVFTMCRYQRAYSIR